MAITIDLPEGSVLAAVSGGADSVAMLRLLADIMESGQRVNRLSQAKTDVQSSGTLAAHYNHCLRPEADEDEAFVRDLCENWGIPFISERGDVAAEAARRKRGVEETARDMRYAFLERVRVQTGADWIATAHTASDNVETLLLNLSRGTGLAGLCGIPQQRGRIIRPLLNVSREEIISFLSERGIDFREDGSNADIRYRRNYIRHNVIPSLREVNPALTGALSRTAELLREDEAYLSSLAADEWGRHGAVSDGRVRFPAKRLNELPKPVASRICRLIVTAINPYPPERVHIEAMLDIAAGGNGRKSDLSGGLTAEKYRNNLVVYRKKFAPPPAGSQ